MLDILFFSLFAVVGVQVSRTDWKTKQIPNCYPLLMLCIGAGRILSSLSGIWPALIGAGICAAPILLMRALWHKVGWGDIRYMAACGFCLGGVTAALGAVCSHLFFYLYIVIQRHRRKIQPGEGIAFAPFITAGFGCIFLLKLIGV